MVTNISIRVEQQLGGVKGMLRFCAAYSSGGFSWRAYSILTGHTPATAILMAELDSPLDWNGVGSPNEPTACSKQTQQSQPHVL